MFVLALALKSSHRTNTVPPFSVGSSAIYERAFSSTTSILFIFKMQYPSWDSELRRDNSRFANVFILEINFHEHLRNYSLGKHPHPGMPRTPLDHGLEYQI